MSILEDAHKAVTAESKVRSYLADKRQITRGQIGRLVAEYLRANVDCEADFIARCVEMSAELAQQMGNADIFKTGFTISGGVPDEEKSNVLPLTPRKE